MEWDEENPSVRVLARGDTVGDSTTSVLFVSPFLVSVS